MNFFFFKKKGFDDGLKKHVSENKVSNPDSNFLLSNDADPTSYVEKSDDGLPVNMLFAKNLPSDDELEEFADVIEHKRAEKEADDDEESESESKNNLNTLSSLKFF